MVDDVVRENNKMALSIILRQIILIASAYNTLLSGNKIAG